jgi:hypothetical protein
MEGILILVILAAALGLRMLPIRSDLPYFSSMDEVSYIETALRFGTGAFELSSYFHGALFQGILFLAYAAYFLAGRLLGFFASPTDYYVTYLADPTPFFLFARGTAAAAGVGVVGLSYAIASRMYHSRVGVLAGLFTAFSLLSFQMSFLGLADMPAVFLLMLAAYLALRSVEQPADRRVYAAAAALVGLAAACKYHAGLGIVIVYVAAYLKAANHANSIGVFVRLSVIGSIAAGVGFCLGIPQVLADPLRFYDDVFVRLSGQYTGYDPVGNAWLFLFTHHLRNGLGTPLLLASLGGIGFAVYKRSQWDLLLLSLPLCMYLLLMRSVGFAYHLLPAIPFVLILAARFVDAVGRQLPRRAVPAASLALAVLVVIPTFLDCVRLIQVMRSPSTKTLAKDWIEDHLPAGATIMAEGYVFTAPVYGPPLLGARSTLERDIAFVKENGGTGLTPELRLAHYDRLYGEFKTYDILRVREMDTEEIARQRPRYLVTTSDKDRLAGDELAAMFTPTGYSQRRVAGREYIARDYTVLAAIAPTAAVTAFFPHLMDEDYRQIREWPLFSNGGSRGPTITIWERRQAS